jgi:hypothetical protein
LSIANVKRLLKANGITVENDQITAKMVELNISELNESGISAVVDSFVSSKLATTQPKSKGEISNAKRLDDAKNIKPGIGDKIKSEINAFEQPIADFSEKVSSDEAYRIYMSHIASMPAKVAEKTAGMIQNHQGDTKSLADVGQGFASALFADFYSDSSQ